MLEPSLGKLILDFIVLSLKPMPLFRMYVPCGCLNSISTSESVIPVPEGRNCKYAFLSPFLLSHSIYSFPNIRILQK